jgi:hypothetical protein
MKYLVDFVSNVPKNLKYMTVNYSDIYEPFIESIRPLPMFMKSESIHGNGITISGTSMSTFIHMDQKDWGDKLLKFIIKDRLKGYNTCVDRSNRGSFTSPHFKRSEAKVNEFYHQGSRILKRRK